MIAVRFHLVKSDLLQQLMLSVILFLSVNCPSGWQSLIILTQYFRMEDFKCLLATEVVQLMCIVPTFFTHLEKEAGKNDLLHLCSTILKTYAKYKQCFSQDSKVCVWVIVSIKMSINYRYGQYIVMISA